MASRRGDVVWELCGAVDNVLLSVIELLRISDGVRRTEARAIVGLDVLGSPCLRLDHRPECHASAGHKDSIG